MGSWCYGLVEIDNKLVLCEVYHINNKVVIKNPACCPVDWKDLDKNKIKMVIDDLTGQLENYKKYKFKCDEE